MNKEQKDPEEINLNAPRLVWYKQKVYKDPNNIDLEAPRLAWYKQEVENTSRHGVLGRHETCSKERI